MVDGDRFGGEPLCLKATGETFDVAAGHCFVLIGDLTFGDDVEFDAAGTFDASDWECILVIIVGSDEVLLEGVLLLRLWAGDSVLEIPRCADGGLRILEEELS